MPIIKILPDEFVLKRNKTLKYCLDELVLKERKLSKTGPPNKLLK